MIKRVVPVVVLSLVVATGVVALLVPSPAGAACVQCPVIENPTCPPCYELIPGSCTRCAHCKRISHCKAH